jgi:hypothetical protein
LRPCAPEINPAPCNAFTPINQPKKGQNARRWKKVPVAFKKSSKTLLTPEAGRPYTAAIETAAPLATPSNASVNDRVE